ncbi:MAG: aldehyde ferredoxin oxidoreductase family protein [Candidatus Promineifilaceae bacterium]
MEGWAGKILDINLTDKSIQTIPLDMEMARLFLGGRGLGARLLWDLVGPEVDPLSADNVLIFTTGPITASSSQTSNRFNVSTKSPLTGAILHANSGGWWGMQFKRTGHDALIVRGRAEKPVMIEIVPDGVTIKDAVHLWGKSVFETTEALGQNRNKRNVLCIGPAGENQVRIASIMNDKERSLARGGAGAVMGSKNLKAIVVEGEERNRPHDQEQFKFMLYETRKLLKASPLTSQAFPEFGTAVVMNVVNEIGALPTRNFQDSQFEGADKISGEAITDNILVTNQACWACPITCTRISKTSSGKEGEGPEFESAWAFGAQCGIDDLDAITEANFLCNDLGLDTISMGNTIGCAMELAERGMLDADLGFGQAQKLQELIEKTAYRSGIGNDLAEGSYRMAEKYGAPELSMTVKKLEMPAYDPRGMQGQGLVYATGNRGACHETGNMLGPEVLALPRLIDRFATQGKAGIVSVHQDSAAVIDSLVYCKFANMAVAEEFFARTLTAVTGEAFTEEDLMQVGERVWTLERLYNLREGFTDADDTLPERLLNEPVREGPSEGFTANLAPMLKEYYAFRGWDKNGVPLPDKLRELSLDFVLEEAL